MSTLEDRTIGKALGARPKEGNLVKSRGDIGIDRSRARSGSISKRRPMPSPAPPGRARQDSPRGTRGRNRKGMREKDLRDMESSMCAWLSQGENPAPGPEGKKGKEGGLRGEKDEPSPRAGSQGSTRDRPQVQSEEHTQKGEIN